MTVLILLICFFVFAICIWVHFIRTYSFWNRLKVNGPNPSYLWGNTKNTILGNTYMAAEIADIYRKYVDEKFVGIYVGMTPILLIRDLELAKHVLIKDFENFTSRGSKFSEAALGTNLFHADGDTWNILRKRMVPMFSSGKIKRMFYLINKSADSLLSFISERIDSKKEWQIQNLTSKYTMSVAGDCIFGFYSDWWTDENNVMLYYGDRLFVPSWRIFVNMVLPGVMMKLNLGFFDEEISGFFKRLGRKLSAEREGKPKVRHDFIDLMLELKEESHIKGHKVMSTEEISLNFNHNVFSAQILILFAASYETTAATLAFLFRELALNTEIQQKVIQEVDIMYEQFGGILTYEAIGELKYMDMVFQETLRLYSILDPIERLSNEDYELPGTDIVIPKGTLFILSAEGIQKDHKHWPEPNKFIPERFSKTGQENGHSMRFLSFGEGPRNCIGNRFASVMARVGLAKFFRHYRVEPNETTMDEIRYTPRRFVRHPKDGIFVKIVKRHY